jgi:predicted Zn finger-like uncharacterized protein
MRIACPSCAATYEVPDSRLKPGQMVRCARCGGEWVPKAEPEHVTESLASDEPETGPYTGQEVETAKAQPALTAMDRLASPPPPPPWSRSLLAAWILTGAVLTGAVAATIIWRQEFMSIWPPSSRILGPNDRLPSKPDRIPGKTAN